MRPTQEQIAGTLKKRYQPDEDSIETITGLTSTVERVWLRKVKP